VAGTVETDNALALELRARWGAATPTAIVEGEQRPVERDGRVVTVALPAGTSELRLER
jgi:hypothetical protein